MLTSHSDMSAAAAPFSTSQHSGTHLGSSMLPLANASAAVL
jgi:hypothetical protein